MTTIEVPWPNFVGPPPNTGVIVETMPGALWRVVNVSRDTDSETATFEVKRVDPHDVRAPLTPTRFSHWRIRP